MTIKTGNVLLLVANYQLHKITVNTKYLVFLSPTITSKVQPMNLGVFNATKTYYRQM